MRRKPKTLKIGDMLYWSSGDDIGECDDRHCTERAFSYNENGDKFCEEHLEEWHEDHDDADDEDDGELYREYESHDGLFRH